MHDAKTVKTQPKLPGIDIISYGQQVLKNREKVRLWCSVQSWVEQHVI